MGNNEKGVQEEWKCIKQTILITTKIMCVVEKIIGKELKNAKGGMKNQMPFLINLQLGNKRRNTRGEEMKLKGKEMGG